MPPPLDTWTFVTCTWKLEMNFDDMASAHILKDYSVFRCVPKLTFQNETKGYVIWNWFVSMYTKF